VAKDMSRIKIARASVTKQHLSLELARSLKALAHANVLVPNGPSRRFMAPGSQ
jgi:hypothetical protein